MKDGSSSYGDDCCWIDDVQFPASKTFMLLPAFELNAQVFENEVTLSEFLEKPEENDVVDEYDDEENLDDADFLPKSYDVKWFCLSALTCLEGQMDKRSYQILYDTLNGVSRSEVASKFNLTQERIRQIVVKATKQAKELLIEQRKNIEEAKEENAQLKAQLMLLKEEVASLKAQLPKEAINRSGNDNEELSTELLSLLETPIVEINFPVRAANILMLMGIKKFADIPRIESSMRLLKERNSGRKTVHDVSQMLEDFYLTFGMSYTEIVNVLKVRDWHTATRKWIRNSENKESIVKRKDDNPEDRIYGEDELISDDQIEHVYLNERGEVIRKEMGGGNTVREENASKEDESEDEEEIKTQVRNGTRVRLLPSQIEGVVVNHITTKGGEKRIVIQKDDGTLFSALDHPYLYEKVRKKRSRIGESRMANDVRVGDKRTDTEPNKKSSIKEQFRSYLAWRKPDSTANGYTNTLDNPVRKWINAEVDEQADSIFSYTTSEDVRLCMDLLKASPGFSAENARQHNRMSAALGQYLLFIEDRERKSKR
jgi:transposase-like protein